MTASRGTASAVQRPGAAGAQSAFRVVYEL